MTQQRQAIDSVAMSHEVPEIIPLDRYDAFKNKVHACIYWLISKAYPNDNIPEEFRAPFYMDNQGTEHVKPSVINQLVSAELYCRACSNIFQNIEYQWQGHWSVIQILSRKGIYVVDSNEEAVTEGLLIQNAPFKPNAHLALIECIMLAYIAEVVTIERVVQSVRRFATFNASSDLPYNSEDALLFWLNKICVTVKHRLEKEQKIQQQQLLQLPVAQAQRIIPKLVPPIPVMDDLLKDMGDGRCVAVALHFYAPQLLQIEDISIHENMSFADSIFNLQVIKSFSMAYMPGSYHLEHEDLLYTPLPLKTNILVYLAEVFWYMEMRRPDWVQPQGVTVERPVEKPESQKPPTGSRIGFTKSRPVSVAISSATKRSFQSSTTPPGPLRASHSNPEINKLVASQSAQPLLPRRYRHQRNSVHLDDKNENKQLRRFSSLENVKNSTIAWPEVADSSYYSGKGDKEGNGNGVNDLMKSEISESGSLLANVSIDTNLDEDLTDLELQSITSSVMSPLQTPTSVRTPSDNGVLMPATVKPRKENMHVIKKEEERGELLKRKTPSVERLNKNGEIPERVDGDSINDSSPDSIPDSIIMDQPPMRTKTKHGEAFFIDTSPTSPVEPAVTGSYTIADKPVTAESAVAAGIPIVSESPRKNPKEYLHGNPHTRHDMNITGSPQHSRHTETPRQPAGKITSMDGAGTNHITDTEISRDRDRELHKLHNDQTDREDTKKLFMMQFGQAMHRQQHVTPHQQDLGGEDGKTSHVACREAYDTTTTDTNHTHGNHADNRTMHLHNNVLTRQHEDELTGHNAHSNTVNHNMTSWLQHTHQHHSTNDNKTDSTSTVPVTSELMQIRMKLEEKRRLIESDKKHLEKSRARQRQRMGKAAFLQVIGKKDGPSSEVDVRERLAPRQQNVGQQPVPDEYYNKSFEKINANLTQLQGELLRLSQQQEQMKTAMTDSPRENEPQQEHFWLDRSGDQRQGDTESGGGVGGFYLGETPSSSVASTPSSTRSWAAENPLSKQSDYVGNWASAPNLTGSKPQRAPSPAYAESPDKYHQIGVTPSKFQPPDRYQQPSVTPSKFQPPDRYQQPSVTPSKFQAPDRYQQPAIIPSKFQRPASPRLQSGFQPGVTPSRYQPMTTPSITPSKFQPPDTGPANFSPAFSISPGEPNTSMGTNFAYSPFTNQTPSSVTGFTRTNQAAPAVTGYTPPSTNQNTSPIPFTLEQAMSSPYPAVSQQPASFAPSASHVSQQRTVQPLQPSATAPIQPAAASTPSPELLPQTLPSPVQQQPVQQQPSPTKQPRVVQQPESIPQKVVETEPVKPTPVIAQVLPKKVESEKKVSQPGDINTIAMTPQPVVLEKSPIIMDIKEEREKQQVQEENAKEEEEGEDGKVRGFIVGQESANDISTAKKKENFLRSRLKRQEEERAKKAAREVEAEKRREEQRIKQEEVERKKEEDRLRRERLKQEYLKRKQQQQQEQEQEKEDKDIIRKPRKPRPKSRVLSQPNLDQDLGSRESVVSTMSTQSQGRVPTSTHTSPGKTVTTVTFSNTLTVTDGQGAASPATTDTSSTPSVTSNGAQHANVFAEYSGPKLFVKPTTKTNRHLITNAITYCVLPGYVNRDMKDKILEELAKAEAKHFLILFRDAGCQFRAFYAYTPETEEIVKFYGTGPRQVAHSMIEKLFKYNSGGKHFSVIPSKTMSVSVDAFTIHNHLWQSKKAGLPKKH
ncbi:calmodulin-regulated spectrin-associated protein 1-like isoform X2 [Glandiceps talaboti]